MENSPPTSTYTVPEICSQLNISPRTFRQLLADFGQFIALEEDSQGLKYVREETMELLRKITRLRNLGTSRDAIREQLVHATGGEPNHPWPPADAREGQGGPEQVIGSTGQEAVDAAVAAEQADATVEAVPGAAFAEDDGETGGDGQPEPWAAGDPVSERLNALAEQLREIELQRTEDRDKLMLSLLKIQKEIQHLRYELAAGQTRSGRKRRGFLARLISG